MKYYFLLVVVFSLSILSFLQNNAMAESSKDSFSHMTISINNMTLDAMVADTPDKMMQGLQYQQRLPYNQGMIFVLSTPQVIPMWMPNMRFPLDIIWFDSDGNILHIEKNVPPCTLPEYSKCPVYNRDGQPAKYALEVTSGFTDRYNISMNSKLAIPIPEFNSLAGMIIMITTIYAIAISRGSSFFV